MEQAIVSDWCKKLRKAIFRNNKSLINEMLEEIKDMDCNNNPLRVAMESEDTDLIEKIVRFIWHIRHIHKEEIIKILIRAHCPLLPCILDDYVNIEIVRLFIKCGIDVNKSYLGNITALHYATERGYIKQINMLLKAGANINVKNNDGKTPIHVAVSSSLFNKFQIIKVFIENEADLNTIDNNNHTLLYTAIHNGYNFDVVDALLDKGAKYKLGPIECKNSKYKHSPLQHLLHCEIGLNDVDDYGNTILHQAVSDGNKNFVTVLIQNGSEINAVNNDNMTPLHHTIHSGDLSKYGQYKKMQTIIVLLTYGADTTIKDKSGSTAWEPFLQKSFAYFAASEKLRSDIMRFYFELGGDVNEKKGDETILQYTYRLSMVHVNGFMFFVAPILRQIAKLESLNLPIHKDDYKLVMETYYFNSYYNVLNDELAKMKTHSVYKNITVYDILTVDDKILLRYVKNKELVKNFNKNNLLLIYPCYGRDIKNRFQIAYKKQKVTKNAMNFMYDIFRFDLTEDIIENIVHHLSLAYKFNLYDQKYLHE